MISCFLSFLIHTSSSGSSGNHVTHFHISSQFVELIQPDLLLLRESVIGALHLHQLEIVKNRKKNSHFILHENHPSKKQDGKWSHLVAVV